VRSARRARSGRRRAAGIALLALTGLVLFGLGVGLGQALRDNPEPGGGVTQVRTLRPLPLAPARETVTVTVEAR
jgi:hypothetical protein